MKFLSVCSGIEAASCAWNPLGWQAVGVSEIEPFSCEILKHYHPSVPNFGDLTQFQKWPIHESVELLVGGTPCQSFSVAGLREGMADPRGNLLLTYLAIAAKLRPKWLLWENVPGVLSINDGRDFGALLGGLAKLGYGFAYRVLDAQYIRVESHARAVPQRRRRVFVVGRLGDWRRAATVLFERESLCWNNPPRREKGQRVAPTVEARVNAGGAGWGTDFMTGGGIAASTEISGNGGGDASVTSKWSKGSGGPAGDECQNLVPVSFQTRIARNGRGQPEEVVPALNGSSAGETSDMRPCVVIPEGVRRLTPLECERLQGFPDHYTAINFRGKKAADGPRYQRLGNSMAVNVMRWIGERIASVEAIK